MFPWALYVSFASSVLRTTSRAFWFFEAYIKVPKSHDLAFLLDLTTDEELIRSLYDDAATLNAYSVAPRYPGDQADMPISRAEEALRSAMSIRAEVLDRASEAGYVSTIIEGEHSE